jgi:hypothetical protein
MADPTYEPNKETREGTLDRLMRQYIRVWIWSIIFGLNTSLLYTFVSGGGSFGGSKYDFNISLVLLLPTALSGSLLIFSWSFLLRYLYLGILPMLYSEGDENHIEYTRYEYARLLWLAMLYTILSVAFRFLGSIVANVFESLSRF